MITFDHVTKIYSADIGKRVVAVDDVSFEVKQGEVFGYLGPNGSGKTTSIKMILGLVTPTKGQIMIEKHTPTDLEIKRKIGYLPENPYFYSHLTGEEVLYFSAELFEIPKNTAKKRVEELLKLVNMEHARSLPMKKYSKGMLQRIGIAQALINDPEIILFDEPMSGLDPIGRKEVKEIIINLKKQGKTVFFCSHILEDAQTLCDRAVIIVDSKLVICDEIKNLTQNGSLEDLFIEVVKEHRNIHGRKNFKD